MSSFDQQFMDIAFEQAMASYNTDEMPIGSVIVIDGQVVGVGRNRERSDSDPTAHAEVVAIRDACRSQGTVKLKEAVLYTTIYPCPMCEAASIEAGIKKIVYGGDTFPYFREVRHGPDALEITGPIDKKCRELFAKRLEERGKIEILNHGNA